MKKNLGTADRIVRYGFAIIILIMYFNHLINGVLALVLVLVAGILIVTSFISFCPIYYPFGISTKKKTAK